ncbi:MAG: hypothetical protein APF80_03795 [Alphaproteobacteria bacterium BRH_c36]|nr:MAG: hypothetical protein APF80_03795 [Alphaproteobacteria bacterium BRH_c36]
MVGTLRLTLPSGRSVEIGTGDDIKAALTLKSYALALRAVRRGTIGFADSYMAEEIETPDIGAVMKFFLANFAEFDSAGRGWFRTRIFDRIGHRRRANTRAGSRRNIAAHYDLGNAFYALWLDPGMTYSSGLYEAGTKTLEEAQEAKLRLIEEALPSKAGDRVLEVGCGWGGVAERLASAGIDVTAITVSREQFSYARARMAQAGVEDRAEIRFQDYRDVTETFEGIVSVEMIEAVGEDHWPVYFAQLRDRLRPGGSAVVQAITIGEESFESYRRHPDFIQRYIFPGGMLPSVGIMRRQAQAHGLTVEVVRQFGGSYAETLRAWRRNFLEAWPQIEAMGFDERFRRLWIYYLTYCEVGFDSGLIDVGVYRFRRID